MATLLGRLYDSAIAVARQWNDKRKGSKSGLMGKAGRALAGSSPTSWRPWSGDPYQQCLEYRNWVYTAVRFRGIKRQTAPIVATIHPTGTKEKFARERRKAYRASGEFLPLRRWVTKSAQTTTV